MKNRAHLAIGFLAIVLSFTLGYSLGQSHSETDQLQGNFDAVHEMSAEEELAEEAPTGDMSIVDIQSEWNGETHGLEITFEVSNAGEDAALGDYSVSAHIRIEDGERKVNFIDTVEGSDTRTIKEGESAYIKAYMPGGEDLSALIEAGGYELKKLEVEL